MTNDKQPIALVTGAAGFIGSHLVERLLVEGWHVRALDLPDASFEQNLTAIIDHLSLELFHIDLLATDITRQPFSDVDCLFHLAGSTNLMQAQKEPASYIQTNCMGTMRILEAARYHGINKIINLSSAAVYGIPDNWPTPEDCSKRPINAYGLSKLMAEQALVHWQQVYGVDSLSFRIFNGYGPRAIHNDVIGVFMSKKLAGEPITITGDGSACRDFIYIDDIVSALLKGAESRHTGKAYNLASGTPRTVKELAELIGGEIEYIPARPGEPPVLCADISQIRTELGWEPKITLEEGVEKLLESTFNQEYRSQEPEFRTVASGCLPSH